MLPRSLIVIVCLVAIIGGVFACRMVGTPKEHVLTIGILQTASHPALDEAREGFIAELTRLMGAKSLEFVVQNAEGSLSSAQTIAKHFHVHKKIDAIYAIATPAVQAMAKVEKEKPIFIAAVSDPESLGILYPGTNLCGTTDRVDTEAQADLVMHLVPDLQRVAILYHPGENNSEVMVKRMQLSLEKRGLEVLTLGVHSESDIVPVVHAAARKAGAILVPTDNLLVGAMPVVAREALRNGCPLIASDLPSAAKGALVAQGADYSDLGKTAAAMAYEVLIEGKSPADAGIVHPSNAKTVFNKNALNQLQIFLPEDSALYDLR
jgi:putative ABC transport system substrate-binding protein